MKLSVAAGLRLLGAICLLGRAQAFLVAPSFRCSFTTAHSQVGSYKAFPSWRRSSLCMQEFDVAASRADAEDRMKKSLDSMQGNLNTLRTGRASPSILDRVAVDYYGTETPLNQVANIKTTSATQLMVEAYDKSIVADIESAILQSGVGLTPNSDGSVIRLNMPPVTEERRKQLGKEAKGMGEEGKVAMRNIRREAVDAVKKAEKSKALGKDQSKDAQDAIQKLTDKYTKLVDEQVAIKEKDIMTV